MIIQNLRPYRQRELNLVHPRTSEEKLERLVRDIYTAASTNLPDDARKTIKELLLNELSDVKIT